MRSAPTVLFLGAPQEPLRLALEAVGLRPLWVPTLDLARASLHPRSVGAVCLFGLGAAEAALLRDWQAAGLAAAVVLREERGRNAHAAGLARLRTLTDPGDEALVRLLLRVARPPAEGRVPLTKGLVDLDGRQLLTDEGPVALTAREAELLAFLAGRPGELVAEDLLLREVWGAAAGVVSRAVHHCLSRLRAKVEVDPAHPVHLRTEPGQGFRFVPLETPGATHPGMDAVTEPVTEPVTAPVTEPVTEPATPRLAALPPLPAPRDAFVGRAADLDALRHRFAAGARVVTLLGVGGMGKTRLATRFAQDAPRAAFADLSAVRSPADLAAAVAQALGLALPHEVDRLGAAIGALGPLLLVLDNAETAPEALAVALDRWLDAAPGLWALVTSRVALGLRGEVTLALQPLDPADAIALFRSRAPGPMEAEAAVGALVERLDHLPLAIELAAARSAVLSVEALTDHLHQRFRLLRRPGGTGRHDALQAVLEGSWQQLSPGARRFGLWLSTCEGGISPAAAEALLPPETTDWAIDLLGDLSAHALVQRGPDGRVRMLPTIRASAQELLQRSGEASRAAAAHRRFFATRFALPLSAARLEELLGERANVLGALQEALNNGVAEVPALLGAAWELLRRQGPASLAVSLAEAALERFTGDPGPLWLICASARRMAGDTAGALHAADAAAQSAEPGLRQQAMNLRGILHITRNEPDQAEVAWEAAFALCGPGASAGRCALLNNLAGLAVQRGDLERAAARFAQACDDARAIADPRRLVLSLDNALLVAVYQGDLEGAAALQAQAARALPAGADAGLRLDHALASATLALERGEADRAAINVAAALELAREMGDPRQEGWCRVTAALLAHWAGDEGRAHEEAAAACLLAQQVQEPTLEGTALGLLAVVDGARGAPGTATLRMEAAWQRLADHPPHAQAWLRQWTIELHLGMGDLAAAAAGFAALPAAVRGVAIRFPQSPAGRLAARLRLG